jgi:heterodisulfide reductase subunit C
VDAILDVRSIAAHEGHILERHRHVANLLQENGHAVPIDDAHKEKRIQLNLKSLPSTVHSHPDDLKDVKRLLSSCGFGEIIGGKDQ